MFLTLLQEMKINNATIAYFIVEEPRLSTEKFNRAVSQALQNGPEIYQVFCYKGKEKLHIFHHKKTAEPSSNR